MVNLNETCKSSPLITMSPSLISKIDSIIESNHNDPTRLVGILLAVQDIIPKQYIPTNVAAYISKRIDLPLSQVYDVLSFYAAISPFERADYIVQVCDSVVCKVVGNEMLIDTLKETLGIEPGQITEDKKFALAFTPCFGACDIAPAIRINGKVYGHLISKEKIIGLIASCRAKEAPNG